ncbi:MAG: phosphoribosylaminoimidazolesuccinocarboxamide synthase [Myxococcaceae bacterium]|nr:phosphoribosylaminoimidazolesuccinocarboxamide synthase [Myxococcaceae bacterium]
MTRPVLSAQLPYTLRETNFPALGRKYRGKVRDTYAAGDRLVLITTDRLSAFDRVLTTVPFKGELLNRLANFWFEKTRHLVPNHVLDAPDPNVIVGRRCEAFPVEIVVRGYITGSLWRDYQKGTHDVYGVPIPSGMKKDQRFDRPIITPSTKAEAGQHDEPISAQQILARGLVSRTDWERACEAALTLFAEGQRWAAERGLILVDTKYEFGKQGDELYVIDEIHTPDCSRYWIAEGYEERFQAGEDQRMMDKENIRQWLITERGWQGHGDPPEIPDDVRVDLAEKYARAYELITGESLQLVAGDPLARILQNLKAKGYL